MSGREKLVRSIVEILRADDSLRREVLDELEGYDPRLPDLSGNRAVCEAIRLRGNPEVLLLGAPPSGKLKER